MPYKDPEKRREYKRRWNEANKEKCREYERRWREANREKYLEIMRNGVKRYQQANPEKKRERDRRWAKANREKKQETQRLYQHANPEKCRASNQRRRARKRDQHGLVPVTAEVINQRFELFGHACAYCGAQHELTVDHFIPMARGGTHAPSNLVPACRSCNSSKGDSDPEQWYRQQPSFNEQRWKQIQKATGHHKAPGQLALI
jgi:5-methylcytosine-specific restriction endonuclease McrA